MDIYHKKAVITGKTPCNNSHKTTQKNYKGAIMAQKKSNKPKSAKPAARPAAKPSKPNQTSKPSGGFTPVSQTIKTTYQNSNGVRRTVIQTTSAPGKKSTTKQGAKKK